VEMDKDMKQLKWIEAAVILAVMLIAVPAHAAGLTVQLSASSTNPRSPQMGDHLSFTSIITNTDSQAHEGVIAWLSLMQVDRGKEQPVDLEDWSAHKAIARSHLGPGERVATQWPMRLIQPGHYRVAVSAVQRDGATLTPSPFVDFTVRPKPVVESKRVLPVALGVPTALALAFGFLAWRRRFGQRVHDV
jgi:hypothetical protein